MVSATDPMTFTAVAAGRSGTAMLAAWIPAGRALTVVPMVVLRDE